jgi:hypothetical protein
MQKTIKAFEEGDVIPSHAKFIYAENIPGKARYFFYEIPEPLDKPEEDYDALLS